MVENVNKVIKLPSSKHYIELLGCQFKDQLNRGQLMSLSGFFEDQLKIFNSDEKPNPFLSSIHHSSHDTTKFTHLVQDLVLLYWDSAFSPSVDSSNNLSTSN